MSERRTDAADDGPFDWLGNPVSYADCPNEETLAAGTCDLGTTCVMDRRARRIDLFFAVNPRREAARRAPPNVLPGMIGDPDPLVRIEVAERLAPESLMLMAADEDFRIRFICAERVPLDRLSRFVEDEDEVVRDCARSRLESGDA